MSRIVQIQTEEVLNEIIEGSMVYMLIKLREDTCLEDIVEAEAFVKLEETYERVSEESAEKDVSAGDEEAEEPEPAAEEPEAEIEEEIADALPPDVPEKYPAKKKKKSPQKKVVDHGKIVACYRAGRPVKWIADEVGCSDQTVYNHLKKEGLC